NILSRYEPFADFCAGYGRFAIGWGATAVTPASCTSNPDPCCATGGDPRWLRQIVAVAGFGATHRLGRSRHGGCRGGSDGGRVRRRDHRRGPSARGAHRESGRALDWGERAGEDG